MKIFLENVGGKRIWNKLFFLGGKVQSHPGKSKVTPIYGNIDSETAEIYKKGDFEFWAWAPHFIMIWNITVRYKFWRSYLFQDA